MKFEIRITNEIAKAALATEGGESKTPRSIQHCDCGADKAHCFDCLFELSCQLETELAEAEKKVFAYKTALELAESELIEARAEIERKNALIESE